MKDIDQFVSEIVLTVEQKSLGGLDWRDRLKESILLFGKENFEAGRHSGYRWGHQDGWDEAWKVYAE